MWQPALQAIDVEDLPSEESRLVKAQQAIYHLCLAVEKDAELKSQLETVKDPDEFIKIAGEKGYKFSILDLQFTINWTLNPNQHEFDEFEDYELGEEELEMVAGGTISGRAMTNNSYWHETGILVNQQCFHLTGGPSLEARSQIETALQSMELWTYLGNGVVQMVDADRKYGSYQLNNIAWDGLAPSLLQNTKDTNKWQNTSTDNSILGLVL